jgi:4'-phosphopantetheinyl transferase
LTLARRPELSTSSVHVWCLDLSLHARPEDSVTLSSDERERAARFRFETDRARYVIARAGLRAVLSRYLDTSPETIRFSYSSTGKPALADPASNICFSVSHSHELGAIAVCRRPVGIDVEHLRSGVEMDNLAERFFSPHDCEVLRGVPPNDRMAAFFQIWTAKEALAKAVGTGLSTPLHSFDIGLDATRNVSLLATRPDAAEARRWHLQTLRLRESYAAALATEGPIDSPEISALTP